MILKDAFVIDRVLLYSIALYQTIRDEILTLGYEVSGLQSEMRYLVDELSNDIESLQYSNNMLFEAFTVKRLQFYLKNIMNFK